MPGPEIATSWSAHHCLCVLPLFDEVTNETVSCPQGGGLKAGVGG